MRPLFAVETTRFPQPWPRLVPHEIVLLDLYLRMVAGGKRTRPISAPCPRMQSSSRRYFPQTRSPGQTGKACSILAERGRLDPPLAIPPELARPIAFRQLRKRYPISPEVPWRFPAKRPSKVDTPWSRPPSSSTLPLRARSSLDEHPQRTRIDLVTLLASIPAIRRRR